MPVSSSWGEKLGGESRDLRFISEFPVLHRSCAHRGITFKGLDGFKRVLPARLWASADCEGGRCACPATAGRSDPGGQTAAQQQEEAAHVQVCAPIFHVLVTEEGKDPNPAAAGEERNS